MRWLDITTVFTMLLGRTCESSTLEGRRVTVAVGHWYPWSDMRTMQPNHSVVGPGDPKPMGVVFRVLDYLQDCVNFTAVLKQPALNYWGTVEADGSWNGMMGMLARNEVDIALGNSLTS